MTNPRTENRAPLRLVPPLPTPRSPAVEPLGDGAAPGEAECLPCYVGRMVAREGCDHTLRWSLRWRDVRAPRAAKLEERLGDGGGFCDCEVLMNVYPWHVADVGTEVGRPPCAGRTGGRATDPCRTPPRRW